MSTKDQVSKGSCLKTALIGLLLIALLGLILDFGWIAGVVWLIFFRKKLNDDPKKQKQRTIIISVLSVFSFLIMIYAFVTDPQIKSITISSNMEGAELEVEQDYIIEIAYEPSDAQPSAFTYHIDGNCATFSKASADDMKAVLHTLSEGTVLISVSSEDISSNVLEFHIAKTETPEEIPETSEDNETGEQVSAASDVFDFSDSSIAYDTPDISNLSIKHGELLSVIRTEGTVVVKAKIEPSLTNQLTIEQNYFNVADLVKNHGFNTCQELQYWAVADMTNGEENKCISFTLDKETIENLYNENIVENQLGDYVSDLWILPSLQDHAEEPPKPVETEETTSNETPTEEAAAQEAIPDTSSDEAPALQDASDNGNNFNTYDNAEQQQTSATFVLNTSTLKIHYPNCKDVKKIAPQNYSTSNLSLEELKSQGYSTCGHCF